MEPVQQLLEASLMQLEENIQPLLVGFLIQPGVIMHLWVVVIVITQVG